MYVGFIFIDTLTLHFTFYNLAGAFIQSNLQVRQDNQVLEGSDSGGAVQILK